MKSLFVHSEFPSTHFDRTMHNPTEINKILDIQTKRAEFFTRRKCAKIFQTHLERNFGFKNFSVVSWQNEDTLHELGTFSDRYLPFSFSNFLEAVSIKVMRISKAFQVLAMATGNAFILSNRN